jgi:predicted kinase
MKLTIIRGVPGSGKSTLARDMQYDSTIQPTVVYEADQYFIRPDGAYAWYASELSNAHEWCLNCAKIALRNGYNVIVANCFIKLSQMEPYIDLAKSIGAELEIIECDGGYKSVHVVPDETVARMRANYEPLKGN